MKDIKSLTLPELQEELGRLGHKKFRAGQIYAWLHEKLADDFDGMTNISKALRETLRKEYEFVRLTMVKVQISQEDGTGKFLFRLPDGHVIESVLMKHRHGNSVCISSQAGCRMGCKFCASALGGWERDLRPSEMLEQVYQIQKWSKERVDNVVVMGTGEPLDNYDALLRFLHLLTGEGGLHISQRNVTVSTCGLVPQIYRLADERLQITLALSLHAPSQEKRRTLMPVANKYGLAEVMDACRYYFEKTGRRITFEYSLMGGVNDTEEDAEALIALVGPLHCHVNLIPVNPVRERDYVQPERRLVELFQKKLEKAGVNATVRREMGRDIDGACGQLRKSFLEQEES